MNLFVSNKYLLFLENHVMLTPSPLNNCYTVIVN